MTKNVKERLYFKISSIFSETRIRMGGKISKKKMAEMLDSAANSLRAEHDRKIADLKKQHDHNLQKSQDQWERDMKNLSQLRLFFKSYYRKMK